MNKITPSALLEEVLADETIVAKVKTAVPGKPERVEDTKAWLKSLQS